MKNKRKEYVGRVLRLLLLLSVLAAAGIPTLLLGSASVFGLLPLAALVTLIVINLVLLLVSWHGLRIEMPEGCIMERGDRSRPPTILIHSQNPLEVTGLTLNAEVYNPCGELIDCKRIPVRIPGHRRAEVMLSDLTTHIGTYQIRAEMVLQDPLRILVLKRSSSSLFTLTVLPRKITFNDVLSPEPHTADLRGNKDAVFDGDMDYSNVRPYEQGDPLRLIHWKLSAHTMALMTRQGDGAQPVHTSVFLDLDVSGQETEDQPEIRDVLIESAEGVCSSLSAVRTPYTLVYYDRVKGILCQYQASVRELSPRLAIPMDKRCSAEELLENEQGRNMMGSSMILITSSYSEDLKNTLLIDARRRSVSLLFVVPSGSTTAQLRELYRELSALRKQGIPCRILADSAEDTPC